MAREFPSRSATGPLVVLGLSCFYHDSACALVIDGKIVAAAQEERFSRVKGDPRFPVNAIAFCLDRARITWSDIDAVAFYEKPLRKFQRIISTGIGFAPGNWPFLRDAWGAWFSGKAAMHKTLRHHLETLSGGQLGKGALLFAEHHQSHAASAYYPSPFESSAILTVDGVGEWTTASAAVGNGNALTPIKEIRFPHSLGLFYSAITYYLGFRVNFGEYKVMGLAPYGTPRYFDKILKEMIDVKEDGSFILNLSYFGYCTDVSMINDAFVSFFGAPPRRADSPLEQFHMDVAASAQAVVEHIIRRLARALRQETGMRNLCLAGGVALNCVANGKLAADGHFDNIWVQPAAGDAGGALGAALAATHQHFGLSMPKSDVSQFDGMNGGYLGPDYSQQDLERRLESVGAKFTKLDDIALINAAADELCDEKVVGWFQGRMEFGPRALGNRSILADPRSPSMQRTVNLKIKFRESFRPFAPAILAEHAADWFEGVKDSPYMSFVAPVAKDKRLEPTPQSGDRQGLDTLSIARSQIAAVTHVDHSARVQTVHRTTNPRFYDLIERFNTITGCPVLLNTSFNVRGEPIVSTPEDAFRCFMGTEMDILVIGNCLLRKEAQDQREDLQHYKNFAPD